MGAVLDELGAASARCNVHYTLSVVTHEGMLHTYCSRGVTIAAPTVRVCVVHVTIAAPTVRVCVVHVVCSRHTAAAVYDESANVIFTWCCVCCCVGYHYYYSVLLLLLQRSL